jgi:hypothetical protein
VLGGRLLTATSGGAGHALGGGRLAARRHAIGRQALDQAIDIAVGSGARGGAGRALATAVAAAASAARRSRRDGFCASRLLSPGCSARTSTLPVPRWVMPRRTAAA